jgi:hypothetical protein
MKEKNRLISIFMLTLVFGGLLAFIYSGMLTEIDTKTAENAALKKQLSEMSVQLQDTSDMLHKTSCIMRIMVETINSPTKMLLAFEQHCSAYADDSDVYMACIVKTIETACSNEGN